MYLVDVRFHAARDFVVADGAEFAWSAVAGRGLLAAFASLAAYVAEGRCGSRAVDQVAAFWAGVHRAASVFTFDSSYTICNAINSLIASCSVFPFPANPVSSSPSIHATQSK